MAEAPAPEVEAPPARPRFRDRLAKARGTVGGYLSVIRSRKVDAETWDELEEALIRADVGVVATQRRARRAAGRGRARRRHRPRRPARPAQGQLKAELSTADRGLHLDVPGSEGARPNVWLFVGVNGVGKTTTIGKVAHQQVERAARVVMAAGDTFRAAAAEQLDDVGRAHRRRHRAGQRGRRSRRRWSSTPCERAAAHGQPTSCSADTAGRLHTKTNLMEELRKVRRVADRDPGNVTEVLLVLDATTGQNGLAQAQQFTEAVDLTGVVLTKLDGSAKGGIVLAIQTSLGIPVKLVGLGETVDDLVEFDPDEFVDALFA